MSEITQKQVDHELDILKKLIAINMLGKGPEAFVSSHEILGVVTEEYYELIGAIKDNSLFHTRRELLDVAVACLFGAASITNDKVKK